MCASYDSGWRVWHTYIGETCTLVPMELFNYITALSKSPLLTNRIYWQAQFQCYVFGYLPPSTSESGDIHSRQVQVSSTFFSSFFNINMLYFLTDVLLPMLQKYLVHFPSLWTSIPKMFNPPPLHLVPCFQKVTFRVPCLCSSNPSTREHGDFNDDDHNVFLYFQIYTPWWWWWQQRRQQW